MDMNVDIPIFNEGRYISDVVKWEAEPLYSRDSVSLALPADTALEIGAVLAQNAAGNYVPLDLAATTGEQLSAGVLLNNHAKKDVAANIATVILARMAMVAKQKLIWPAGATEAQIAGGLDELKALGIVAREEM